MRYSSVRGGRSILHRLEARRMGVMLDGTFQRCQWRKLVSSNVMRILVSLLGSKLV